MNSLDLRSLFLDYSQIKKLTDRTIPIPMEVIFIGGKVLQF